MAEFCLDCWNKLNKTQFTEKAYVLSRELDLCEECGEWKPVIVRVRRFPALYVIRTFVRAKMRRKEEENDRG